MRARGLRDASGELAGLLWLLRDLSEQTRLTADLARLQAAGAQELRSRTMELEAVVRLQTLALHADLGAQCDPPAVLQRLASRASKLILSGGPPDATRDALAQAILDAFDDACHPGTVLAGDAKESRSDEPPAPSSGRGDMLVVDDNPDIGVLLEMVLSAEGYRCTTLSSLADAERFLQTSRFDLVITDAFSATATAVPSTLASLLSAAGATPVVLATGHVPDEAAMRAAGFAAVVVKPFDLEQFIARIAALVPAAPA